jgi:uncharacterized phiE125 gp8 family phage protein
MYLTQTAAPSALPLSLAEVKSHLRVTHTDDDVLISALIASATGQYDGRSGILGRALMTQSWEYRCDLFPAAWPFAIDLPFSPLQTVASVKFIDGDGVLQTMPGTDYVVEAGEFVGRIVLGYGKSWPSPRYEANAVRIVFTAGYGSAADVPAPIRLALLLLIAHYYISREAYADTHRYTDQAIEGLLGPYRLRRI